MSSLPAESAAALAPVRQALRAAAEKQAAEIGDDGRQQAKTLLAAARAEAERITAAAAREGGAAARSEAALRFSRCRREAHELVLARRSAVLAELRRQLATRASELQADGRYPALLARLTEHCRHLLGPGAGITVSPGGGVIAEAGSRRLDLSLPVLAGLALDALAEAGEPWTG